MHDIRAIREDPAAFDAGLQKRGLGPQAAGLLQRDEARRGKVSEAQAQQTRRNEVSKEIGKAKAARDETTAHALMAEVAGLKDRMAEIEAEAAEAGRALEAALAALPNIPAVDVPEGEDETGNVELTRWGTPRTFDFEPK